MECEEELFAIFMDLFLPGVLSDFFRHVIPVNNFAPDDLNLIWVHAKIIVSLEICDWRVMKDTDF